ncbi:energy-coupling factor ABC transporter ATP-binding protein [Paenisporosarcina cavernae]|uniref:Energy-coupling factor ABC transporter ATP-binding protein n=1 Tax=Paenisporosarcina cavernae TaxID=2320858 RepID=A0A385YUL8_9BACL|nr:energy-coupling factor ABC transporter ATP-binding protein [Paenisporosarcina cavernae]AYC30585.1 energy-coupling factor ABC transporter ATP-binding protein [Paenisporosarcina cavernae]
MKHIIELQQVTFSYDPENNVKPAVQNVSFTVNEGEWVAIVGHNGSGKSTLAKLVNGLLFPNEGKVRMFGMDMGEDTIWEIRSKMGMVFQNPDNQFVGATVQDDVAFALENYGVPFEEMVQRVHDSLTQVKMEEFLDQEPHHLSGGQKQRVAIAGALALRPELLILDEATSMLDPQGRKEVIQSLQQLRETTNLTVVSITHDLEEALLADRVILMNQGAKYMEGKPMEVFEDAATIERLGLDLPFPLKMHHLLRDEEITLPVAVTSDEELVNELWKLYSNK